MTIGQRIAELRKNCGYSQEYIAEKLDVSRQAVSKWESDKSSPSTDNLIKLSELLCSTVEYIAIGKTEQAMAEPVVQYVVMQKPPRKKMKWQKTLIITVGVIFAVLIVLWAGLHIFPPIEWDSGVCGGGYSGDIYRKYETELLTWFVNNNDGNITSIKVINVPEVTWEGRTIHIGIPIRYTHKERGECCELVYFLGKKYWTDHFDWRLITIDGSYTPKEGEPITHWGEDGKPIDNYYELLEKELLAQNKA